MASNIDSKRQLGDLNSKLIDPQLASQNKMTKENIEYKNVVFLGKKTHSPISEKIITTFSPQKKCIECNMIYNKSDILECKNCHNFLCKNCISKSKEIEIDSENYCICKKCKENRENKEKEESMENRENRENVENAESKENVENKEKDIALFKCYIYENQNKIEKAYNFYTITKEQKENFQIELKKNKYKFFR